MTHTRYRIANKRFFVILSIFIIDCVTSSGNLDLIAINIMRWFYTSGTSNALGDFIRNVLLDLSYTWLSSHKTKIFSYYKFLLAMLQKLSKDMSGIDICKVFVAFQFQYFTLTDKNYPYCYYYTRQYYTSDFILLM